MTKRPLRQLPGFTLVEIMASVVIFTAVIGVLFSAMAAMQRTDLFRRDNQELAQAADFAFEPLIQRLKEADAKETLSTAEGCVTVQGYYTTNRSGVVDAAPLLDGSFHTFTNETGRLVVITSERQFDASIGTTRKWVRRDYFVQSKNGVKTLVEKTYKAVGPNYTWPKPLRLDPTQCETITQHWQPEIEQATAREVEKDLTGTDVTVDNFSVSIIPATLPPAVGSDDVAIKQRAPLITISLTVSNPKSKVANPVTLRTTLTPTFSYGETREN